ncbi:MAG: Fic family protein [Pyrinomonadaceae bacterium]|nr:Fic family protein [Pyrinomonadaceae bacterium]
MDWAKFSFNFNLDVEGLLPDVVSIEAYREAALNLVLPPDWREQLDKLNRVRAVHGTTALEGNPLSEAEVAQQIETLEEAEQEVVNRMSKEQLQIRNSGLGQEWVRQRFYPGSAPLTVSDILELHKMTTQHSDVTNNVPGRFRTFSVTVGSPEVGGVHRGAPHDRLSQLMNEYIEFVSSRRLMAYHPVIRALLSHFFLVTIHPFGDGNGRVSRLVEAGILFQGGYNVHGFYGLSNYFYRNETEYKTLLQKCRESVPFDVTSFVIFGLKGFARELKGINNFIKTKLNRVVYRTMLVRAFNTRTGSRRRLINQREYNLLDFLIVETEPNDPFSDSPSKRIKLSELREVPYIQAVYRNVTPRTFFRELTRLRQMGFIYFTQVEESREWIIELDFGAIGRY